MVVSTSSNLQSSKYKCFWDFLHVQTGAQIIVALVLFNCLMSFGDTLNDKKNCGVVDLIVQYLGIFFQALIFIEILRGIRRSDAFLLLPSLLCTACMAAVYGVGSFICLIAVDSKSSLGRLTRSSLEAAIGEKVTVDGLVSAIAYSAANMVINIFIFDILYRCSKYITEKSRQERNAHVLPVAVQSSFPRVKESIAA